MDRIYDPRKNTYNITVSFDPERDLKYNFQNDLKNNLGQLRSWDNGFYGQPFSYRSQWEKQNQAKIAGKDKSWIDRLWKNQMYAKYFGKDTLLSTTLLPEERDKQVRDYLVNRNFNKIYGNDKNFGQLDSLTPQGKEDLMKSGYMNDEELATRKLQEKYKKANEFTGLDRLKSAGRNAFSLGATGLGTGLSFGKIGAIAGTAVGAIAGALGGLYDPTSDYKHRQEDLQEENDDTLNKVQVADNKRKKAIVQKDTDSIYNSLNKAYTDGIIDDDKINKMFDDLATNKTVTVKDANGKPVSVDYQGSNYYSAFKNGSAFEHFSPEEKLKYIAQTQALANKFGEGAAMNVLDQDMQNYGYDNQHSLTWVGNTLKNIWVGGVANLAQGITGMGALAAETIYGNKGLANYLEGKDAETGEENSFLLSPKYWQKVDQYNTFDRGAIARADRNGGVSRYSNILKPGTENDFWSWNTLHELVKQNKYIWSQVLPNIAAAKALSAVTKAAGGVEKAAGVLSTESTLASKAINKVGSAAIVAGSTVGQDMAMGLQAYDDVLKENNDKLNEIINQEVNAEVNARIKSKEGRRQIQAAINAENARRKRNTKEGGSYIGISKEEVEEAYRMHLMPEIKKQVEARHAEDRQKARESAADAYITDASIEALRMSANAGAFKGYLFDRGTRNALRMNNPFVETVTRNGKLAVAENATRKAVAREIGKNIWGEAHEEYFDDVTQGFAESFGIQDYNNYLLNKYDPKVYGNVLDDYVNPFMAALHGAGRASMEKQSFIDGALGALGVVTTGGLNVMGALSHKEKMKQAKEAGYTPSTAEKLTSFISSPLLDAVSEAKRRTRMTQEAVNTANKILADREADFTSMAETTAALNRKAAAREGASMLEAEDAKDREAFSVASALLSLGENAALVNSREANDKDSGFWSSFGIRRQSPGVTAYQKFMQDLSDASAIDDDFQYVEGDKEITDSDNKKTARAKRQSTLIDTFLGLDANKGIVENNDRETQIAIAKDRLKKNADNLTNVMNRMREVKQKFDNSIAAERLHPDLQQQLIYQYAMDSQWQKRLGELEEKIQGKDRKGESNEDNELIAKYGGKGAADEEAGRIKEKISKTEDKIKEIKKELEESYDPRLSVAENSRKKAMLGFMEKSFKKELENQKGQLKQAEQDASRLTELLKPVHEDGGTQKILSAEEIISLSPEARRRMLDPYHRKDYLSKQQEEIERAEQLLTADGTPLEEMQQNIKDAAVLSQRLNDNAAVRKKIMENPMEANEMRASAIANRKAKIVKYFNDKVIAQEMADLLSNNKALVDDDSATKYLSSKSTATLLGMRAATAKESGKHISDKTARTIQDSIKAILTERAGRKKGISDMDGYLRRTKNLPTERVVIDNNGEPSKLESSTRELSGNDRTLLDYALDYAVDKDIPVEDLGDAVRSQEFSDYVQERDHSIRSYDLDTDNTQIATEENSLGLNSPEYSDYAGTLVDDAVQAYTNSKTKTAEDTDGTKAENTGENAEEKRTSPISSSTAEAAPEARVKESAKTDEKGKSESTKTEPGEPRRKEHSTGAASNPDAEVHPTNGNISGGAKSESQKNNKKIDSTDNSGKDNKAKSQDNKEDKSEAIIETDNQTRADSAYATNPDFVGDLKALYDKVDKFPNISDDTKKKIKDIIENASTTASYDSIEELKNAIKSEGANNVDAVMDDKIQSALERLLLNYRPNTEEANSETAPVDNKEGQQAEESVIPTSPATSLESMDLNYILNSKIMTPLANYAREHGMPDFLQRLFEYRNKQWKDYRDHGKNVRDLNVEFLYDPQLAAQVKQGIENNGGTYVAGMSAPIVMVMRITDENKHLVKDDSHLIKVKTADNKEHSYMPIGFMPANDNRHISSSGNMKAIRDRIDWNDRVWDSKKGKPGDEVKAQILKYPNHKEIVMPIRSLNVVTEEELRPKTTAETPRKDAETLMEENINQETETLVNTTKEERQRYEDAKAEGKEALRRTFLYKKMRDAFTSRLYKQEENAGKDKSRPWKFLKFNIEKGSRSSYDKTVLIKAISETKDTNSDRLITDMLRGNTDPYDIVVSNSRIGRLFHALRRLKFDSEGLMDTEGNVTDPKAFAKKLSIFRDEIEKAIENNFSINYLEVEVENKPEKTSDGSGLKVNVMSDGTLLSSFTFPLHGEISDTSYADFIRSLILDEDGKVRRTSDGKYELIKWQVNYEDANTKDSSEPLTVREAAKWNLNSLYDDGVFVMQTTKLAYPVSNIELGIPQNTREKLWPSQPSPSDIKAPEATETKRSDEAIAKDGEKVDADLGLEIRDEGLGSRDEGLEMRDERLENRDEKSGLSGMIKDTIKKMVSNSLSRVLSSDGKHYEIDGQEWARVTSIKSAFDSDATVERFNENSPYITPSTLLGNSFDEFGRDFMNGVFDGLSYNNLQNYFRDNYTNATEKQYEETYNGLSKFKSFLASKGQTIVKTGDAKEPGRITAKGTLNVRVKDQNGKVRTKKVRVAGTVDLLTVDKDGKFYLYDFKTHRSDTFDDNTAEKHGYNRQLSMYAKFLEEEYGIKITSINILPVKVDAYNVHENDFRESPNVKGLLEYKLKSEPESAYRPYTSNFKIEDSFQLKRLTDEEMNVDFDKMSAEEKEAIQEAVNDQSATPQQEEKVEGVAVEEDKKDKVTIDNTTNSLTTEGDDFGRSYDSMGIFDESADDSISNSDGLTDIFGDTDRITEEEKHDEDCKK